MFVATHFEVFPHQYVTAGCETNTAAKNAFVRQTTPRSVST